MTLGLLLLEMLLLREYCPGGAGLAGADALGDGGHGGHGVSGLATKAELRSIQG